MFTKVKNMDASFRQMRMLMLGIMCACFLLTGGVLLFTYRLLTRLQDRVYVLAQGKALQAFSASGRENIPVEARDHVQNFHRLFFTLDPDDQAIQHNLDQALYLADQSAKRVYDDLQENGFYARILSGNVNQTIQIDSVQLGLDDYPFAFRCFARQQIIRPQSLTDRRLITEGFLRQVSRSDNNPHGFLIERWKIVLNEDLSSQSRRR